MLLGKEKISTSHGLPLVVVKTSGTDRQGNTILYLSFAKFATKIPDNTPIVGAKSLIVDLTFRCNSDVLRNVDNVFDTE